MASNPDPTQDFVAQVRNSLLKGFIIPVSVLIFYALAPVWLDHNLHESVAEDIAKATGLSAADKADRLASYARIDFGEVCGAAPAQLQRLRSNLEQAGICGQFLRLRWSFWLSVLLVAILCGVSLATYMLNRRVRSSRELLIPSYRMAWRLSIFAALFKVALLIPLLAYGTFELTTLAAEQYFPKLILVIVIGGVIALWRAIVILLKRVPLEFDVAMTRPVTADDAPRLWNDVKEAAIKLGTTPPDHILVGMDYNFYVTELAVKYRSGVTAGRTLYLSHPLMQQLAPDEVLAVIGHELGHFRGDDTRITREFYPMRFKANATLHAMAGSGWVGWTSVHALLFFHWSFSSTEQAVSRERELLADRAAADLTSAGVIGRALVKIQVFAEAFNRTVAGKAPNPFAVPLVPYIRDQLVPRAEFWTQLFEKKAAHPLDSHPSLRVRLEALGQPVDPESAVAIATGETDLAFNRWFAGRDDLFGGIVEEAMQQINRVRAMTADYATEGGKQLLEQHFPEIRWMTRSFSLWLKIVGCGFGTLIALILFAVVDGWEVKSGMMVFALICAIPAVLQWRRHRNGVFVLRVDSLSYSGWLRPLMFADVARISAMSSYGAITLTFHLKTAAPGIWKFSPFNKIRVRSVSLPLGNIAGKQNDTLQTIHRYLSRQIPS